MRPLTLTMEAFGSYGKSETIDFTELGAHRLFLIHGPTGSGKTTVLDGICFALYGVATGQDRDAKEFRSDFATPTEVTKVTLDFAIGESSYRIVRQPAQERAKRRGEGMTTSPVAATMWERTDLEDGDEGTVLASKWSDVTAKVEELLGFRSEQFQQVIVLPQGRFRDLLMASSNAREEILQQLFDTNFYKKIQNSLKERAKTLAREIDKHRTSRTTLLDQCDCDNEGELAEFIEELKTDQKSQEKIALSASKKAKVAQQVLSDSRSVEERFSLQDKFAKEMSDLETQAEAITKDRELLELANKAANLADFFESVEMARKQRTDAQSALSEAKELCQEAKKLDEKKKKELAKQKSRDEERKDLAKEIENLKRIRPVMSELAKERAARDELRQREKIETGKLRALTDEKKQLKGKIEKASVAIKKLTEKRRDKELLKKELEEAKGQLDLSIDLAKKRAEIAAAEKDEKARSEDAIDKAERLKKRRKRLEQLLKLRDRGSAANLASQLQPGDPCPVCGSTTHPKPALSDAHIPDENAINDAKRAVETAEGETDDAKSMAHEVSKRLAKLRGELDTLSDNFSGTADREKLESVVDNAKLSLEKHEQESEELNRQQSELEGLQEAFDENESEIDRYRNAKDESTKDLSATEAKLEEMEKRAGKDYVSEAAVDKALDKANDSLDKSQSALESAIEGERDASSEFVRLDTEFKRADRDKKIAEKKSAAAEENWNTRLEKAGFKSEKAFVDAVLPDDTRNDLTGGIKEYEKHFEKVKIRYEDLKAELKEKKRPDVNALQKAADDLEAERSEAEKAVAANQEKIKGLIGVQDRLENLAKHLEDLDEKYGIVGTLARTADGQNSMRVSLQRFVLATRLDDVLTAASHRLSLMTKGRFRIQRNRAADDKRAAGGLELEVEDAYTGSCRPVSTLSGGESFQAALSLALGLSEVVQAYAGGIRLDTIFVDEGFGSLDPEALELAINALIDLQATGRMVGVISHVPELKERIDVRLRISAGKSGSTASFQLP